jgi:SAM-dependent methyltransferase
MAVEVRSGPGRWGDARRVRGIDALAHEGFSRGAEAYERGRPCYPREAVGWICAGLEVGAGSRVLDLGAGTGKLARLVREVSGAEVIAVEPVPEMREIAAAHGLQVLDGTAEDLGVARASVDAIVCGEAFHWFDGPRTLAEMARVLRPGGGVGLLWNVHAWDRGAGWVQAVERLLAPYSDGRADTRYGSGAWRVAFERDPRWSPLEQRVFGHVLRLDTSALVDHVDSVAFVAALPDAARAELLGEVRRIASDLSSPLTIPYRTDAYATRGRVKAGR